MIRSALRVMVGAIVVVTAYWNILGFNKNSIDNLAIRSEDPVVVQEARVSVIRLKLIEVGYRSGRIAFVTAGDLAGKPRTAEADLTWSILRYAMIPWLLVRDTLDTPYVIADFAKAEAAPELGANFITVYAGNGLILFQRKTQ